MTVALTIHRVHAIEYTMPLKRPYGTARGVTKASTSLLARIHSSTDTTQIVGVGESQPRRRLSGDVDINTAWEFFQVATRTLVGETFTYANTTEGLAVVREFMHRLAELAREKSSDLNADKPFRGTLLGIEVALLDTVSQSLAIPISKLLGESRKTVEITVRTLSTQNTETELTKKIAQQANQFPMVRIKGSGNVHADLNLLRLVHNTNESARASKPIWLDLNEGFEPEEASTFIREVGKNITKGLLPPVITLEQPVPHESRASLPELQRIADAAASSVSGAEIIIMPDESIWDISDLEWLHARGGCRAINIKTAKTGGLIPSLELARRAIELDPNIRICIGGMVGVSDITTWSLANLAKALPRVDYITAVPPGSPIERISTPLTKFKPKTTILMDSPHPGLGARLAYETLIPFIKRHVWFPRPPQMAGIEALNRYDVGHLRGFGKLQLDNHLLERESLALGLNTYRTNRIGFAARGDTSNVMGFWWTKSSNSSRISTAVTSDKHSTRLLLERAGIPVPHGMPFSSHDVEEAIEYASSLGFPVVLKPLRGTGGRGVVTNIESAKDLRWALTALRGTGYEGKDFVVEEQIMGTSGRIFVVGDQVLSMIQWPNGTIVGDGELTVGELLLRKHRLRDRNPHLMNRQLKFDDGMVYQLQKQGLDYDSVPKVGQEVSFTLNPNPQQGGETRDALDDLHPSFVEASIDAVKAIPGLAFSGVDWIIPDLTRPLSEQRAAICELNAHPSQSGNEFPLYGRPAKVSRAIVRLAADHHGLSLADEPATELTVELTISGYRLGNDYVDWFAGKASQFGLTGWLRVWTTQSITAGLFGKSEHVSALASLAITGPQSSTVESVETVHTTHPVKPAHFEIIKE